MEERPKIGVAVYILKDNKVLLLRRKGSHGEGTWCPPGGHLEFGESLEDCAVREALEETNVKIKNIRFGTATNDIFKEEKKHYITIHMIADYASGEAKIIEPGKCTDIGWFSWRALPKPLFLPVENLVKKGYSPTKQ